MRGRVGEARRNGRGGFQRFPPHPTDGVNPAEKAGPMIQDRRGGKPDGVDFVWNLEISSFPQNPPPAVLWYYYTSTHAGQSPLGEAKGCDQEPEVKSSSRTGPNGSAAVTAHLLLLPRRRVHLGCTARVPKECPPAPDQQKGGHQIVHRIQAGDRFDRDSGAACR